VTAGQQLDTQNLEAVGHSTQPPARLTEASLIKELESRGIGRPSTYATIIDTILRREYVFKKGNALVPSFTAFAVVKLMEQYLAHLVDYAFTANMEDDLDKISLGEAESIAYLRGFYFGNGSKGLRGLLDEVSEKIDPRQVCTIEFAWQVGVEAAPQVRVGRYGPYLAVGDLRAGIPDDLPPDELTLAKAQELLAKEATGPKQLGIDPQTQLTVYLRDGRYGPYLQLGDVEKGSKKKPKMASLLPGMEPGTVTLEQALAVLSLPRDLGARSTPTRTTTGRG
jgi:DNA topoisomerase-1